MDLRQLQAFLAVVDHGGFTAAARATHTVQSNISTHVARLERALEATLIDRATGRPTQEGEAVVARARRIQNELSALEGDVASLQGSPRGTVRLGIIGTTARWLTPLVVDGLAKETPDVRPVVVDATTSSQVLRLVEGDLDFGVVALPVDDPEVRTRKLFTEENVVIAPAGHPLTTATDPLGVGDLAGEELLLASPGTTFRRVVDEAFDAADLTPKVKVEVDGLRLLATLAFKGFGVAIVPASAAPGWVGGDWVELAVEGLGRRTVGIATRRRGMLSLAAQSTIELVEKVVEREAAELRGIDLHER
ncbi:MAG: LysR family transcriptional regulator [Acidimicrobiales bacterium]